MKFYPTKNHPSCFIKGCFLLVKIYLLMLILYRGCIFFRFQYMTWNFNAHGGASVFRDACMELKPVLLASTDSILLFREYDLPPKHPLRKLRPQFLSYGGYNATNAIYNIRITGGFYKTGYIIFESKDNIPPRIFLGRDGSAIIKNIGDGVFIYQSVGSNI